ncbi:MAG TPA: glycosyltransferase [Solirubrobacteraceae bacterium]|nr:glycosyltransferase [Solirubrobacteraceae bacterium]
MDERAAGSQPRVLVLSATVGSSHNKMADALREEVLAIAPGAQVTTLRDFKPLGGRLGSYLDWSFRVHFGQLGWTYDLTYLLFTRRRAAQRFGEESLYRIAGAQLARVIEEHGADVVVSTHPVFNPVLAGLRRDGRLPVAAATVCCELGGLEFWLQRDLDLHMMIYPEAAEVARATLAGVRAESVRPLLGAAFFEPAQPERVAGALPPGDGPLVLISGGGWGLGDLHGATAAALRVMDARVVVVAGQNVELERSLRHRYAADRRVQVLGFTDAMGDLLACADVFVHTTVGISCLEARLRERPTICFGLFVGHIRDNAAALARHGYVELARSQPELTAAIARRVHESSRPQLDWRSLRSAGEAALELAGRAAGAQPRPRAGRDGAEMPGGDGAEVSRGQAGELAAH